MTLIPQVSPYQATEAVSVTQAIKLFEKRQYGQAIKVCDRVLELMPENATAICVRAHCNWRLDGDVDECIAECRRALEIAPDAPVAKRYLSNILVSAGYMDEAKKLLEEVLEENEDHSLAFFEYAEITKFKEETPLVKRLYERFKNNSLPQGRHSSYGFSLAKVYDDLKMPERAMELIDVANAGVDHSYKKEKYDAKTADLLKLKEYGIENTSSLPPRDRPPIFIVGMPRSGTTLIETIFSRHPDIFAAGELTYLSQVEGRLLDFYSAKAKEPIGQHTVLKYVDRDALRANRDQILKAVREKAGHKINRFTDKLPGNVMRLPLISRMFPNAPIIFARRHPLDCCISNYFKRFHKALDFSFGQQSLGEFYRYTMDQVAISRSFLPNPFLDVSYDLLVADPEPQVRRMIKFAGLAWNDDCLTPEQSNRATVMTASKWQVRQPIYTTSSAKWKRYEPYIGDMIEGMGGMDWIEQHVAETNEAGQSEV